MNLLKKVKTGLKSLVSRGIPENLWIKCDRCPQSVFRRKVEQGSGTCPNCGGHFRIGQREYFELLIDGGSFEEVAGEVKSKDFLKFKDRISYSERLKQMRKKTGLKAAIYTGIGRIDGRDVGVGIHEIGFIGGSLGSAEGERICRLINRCTLDRLPLVLVCRSGGARMQESAMSLMQMAKVSAKLAGFSQEGLPYIAIPCDPTTAGATFLPPLFLGRRPHVVSAGGAATPHGLGSLNEMAPLPRNRPQGIGFSPCATLFRNPGKK